MFLRFPSELTKETYPQAWAYVSRKFIRSRQCLAAENPVERAGHFLFLGLLFFFVNGLMYDHLSLPELQDFYRKAPWFLQLWRRFAADILLPASRVLPLARVWSDMLCCLLISWTVPVAASCLIFGIVLLVYRPKVSGAPETPDSLEGAQTLLNTARVASARRPQHPAAASASMFYLLATTILLAIFVVLRIQEGGFFSGAASADYVRYFIAMLCLLCCYSIVNYPLALLLRLLCRCAVPNRHLFQMEAYLRQYIIESRKDVPVQPLPVTDPDTLPKGFSRFLSQIWLLGFPNPITAETVAAAWQWALRRLRWSEKKKVMYKIANRISAPLFAISLTCFVFEVLCRLDSPVLQLYLTKLSKIQDIWNGIRPMLYTDGASQFQQALSWAKVLYGVPFAISAAVALAVGLVYPIKAKHPDTADTPTEQARQLCLTLRRIRANASLTKSNLAVLCNVLFAFLWGITAFGMVVFYLNDPAFADLIQTNGTRIGWFVFALAIGLSLAYQVIALPLTLPLRLLCATWIPRKILTLAEDWFTRCEDAASAQQSPTPTSEE